MNSPWRVIGDPGPEGGAGRDVPQRGQVGGGWKMWGRGSMGTECGDKESGPQVGVFGGLELEVIRPFL